MAERIQKITGPRGISYLVRVEFPPDPVTGKRRQRSKAFKTKREAEKHLAVWLVEIERGTAIDGAKMTVGQYLLHWLETSVKHTVRRSTYLSYEHLIRNHLIPALGAVSLQKLQPVQVQAFYSEKLNAGRSDGKGGGLSPRTVRYLHTVLRKALQQAMKWGMVARNVCDATDPPRAVRPHVKIWTPEEARQFLQAAAEDTYAVAWLVALTTGLRRGELLAIRWQDVDLTKGLLHVRQSLNAVGGERYFEQPKTAAGRRVVALSSETVAALRIHRVRQNAQRLRCGSAWRDHDLIFTVPDGGPVWPDDLTHRFNVLVKAAGAPRIRLHDLRHTHATMLLKEGVHLKIVSERLGHGGIQITADVDSHVTPDMQRQAADSVDSALFGGDVKASVK